MKKWSNLQFTFKFFGFSSKIMNFWVSILNFHYFVIILLILKEWTLVQNDNIFNIFEEKIKESGLKQFVEWNYSSNLPLSYKIFQFNQKNSILLALKRNHTRILDWKIHNFEEIYLFVISVNGPVNRWNG